MAKLKDFQIAYKCKNEKTNGFLVLESAIKCVLKLN